MAFTRVRSCALFVAIAIASLFPARAQNARLDHATPQDSRIILLLAQLADQSGASDDLAFAVRTQSQIAALLWSHDRERARAIFRRAFDSLSPAVLRKAEEGRQSTSPHPDLTTMQKGQLRVELLNQIAGRDPELAEDLARALADSIDGVGEESRNLSLSFDYERRGPAAGGDDLSSPSALFGERDEEQRELLMSVALQIVERDPYRAMALGQLSLGSGANGGHAGSIVSPHFARLLMLMRAADASLADLLFASALARLEKQPVAPLADIHTLGSYLVASANAPPGNSAHKAVVARFLNFAFDQMMRQGVKSGTGVSGATADSELESAAYFVGRQLDELFARYLPDKLGQLQRRITELNRPGGPERIIDPVPTPPSDPADIAREARAASDEKERNALYARAALGWLARGELNEAQKAAASISDASVRDRVLVQLTRRQAAEGRIEDAVAAARKIADRMERVSALVNLAGVALAAKDRVCAIGLLNEAEKDATGDTPSIARAQALLTIARTFAGFDMLRAFEVMQTAVKAINEIPDPTSAQAQASDKKHGEAYSLNLEGTLSALARADFDRALALAQQLSLKEVSVAAQLAVCKGGLSAAPPKKTLPDPDRADAGAPL